MATATELKTFAQKTTFAIPTVDYQVGVPAGTALQSFKAIGANIPGVIYNAAANTLRIQADGITLSGYDFRGVTVSVEANNVTLKNSTFDASAGVYSVIQAKNKTGLTVDHSSFDGLKLNKSFADFINGQDGKVTITYNQFLNAPSDAIQLKSGVVDHNYFSGAGYAAGAHADAITVDGATGPVSITNNFIDYRNAADALAKTTSAINIGNYFGSNKPIEVTGNVLLGGAYTVYVQDFGANKYDSVKVAGNYVGEAMFGDLYPNRLPTSLSYAQNGTTVGAEAAPAPLAPAAKVAAPVVEVKAAPIEAIGQKIFGKAGIAETLQGGAGQDSIYGNGGGDKLIGDGGRDFLFGGKGTDIFVYKAVTDSTVKAWDVIGGFEVGVDKIDLKAIAGAAGLTFIGDAAFGGKAGSVHAVVSGTSTVVEADMNGDRVADLKIELQGVHKLSAIDFIL
jgi:serralysin